MNVQAAPGGGRRGAHAYGHFHQPPGGGEWKEKCCK